MIYIYTHTNSELVHVWRRHEREKERSCSLTDQ